MGVAYPEGVAVADQQPHHELHLFEQIGELVRAMAPDDGGEPKYRAHRRGVKVWFGTEKPTRFHYEAQLLPSRLAPSAGAGPDDLTLEVGFHAEHGDERRNAQVLDRLRDHERTWRKPLGSRAELGPFLGNPSWGRLSEIWVEKDLGDPDLPFELASRLVDYIDAVEAILADDDSDGGTGPTGRAVNARS